MSRFKSWWHAPVTAKDRLLGAFVGAFAGFWLGLLSSAALAPAFLQPVMFIILVMAGGVLVGVAFPKVTTIALFPFGVFGGS